MDLRKAWCLYLVPDKLNSNSMIMRGIKRGPSGGSQTNRYRKIDE